MIKILVADTQPFLLAVLELFVQNEKELNIVGSAKNEAVKEGGLITSNVILERTSIEFNSDFHIKLVIHAEDLSLDRDNKDYFPELSILTKDKSGTPKRSKEKAKVKFSDASPVG